LLGYAEEKGERRGKGERKADTGLILNFSLGLWQGEERGRRSLCKGWKRPDQSDSFYSMVLVGKKRWKEKKGTMSEEYLISSSSLNKEKEKGVNHGRKGRGVSDCCTSSIFSSL